MLITKEEKLAQVMIQIRKCFNQMKALSDRMHQSYGVTSAMRSVVEYLAQHGSDTVPRIARKKAVTRQHIQSIVNELIRKQLVESCVNPSHKRSVLIRLSAEGENLYRKIAAAERRPLKHIADSLEGLPMNGAFETLSALSEQLDHQLIDVDSKEG